MKKLCVWAVAALLMAACTPKAEKATDSGLFACDRILQCGLGG